MRNLDFTLLPCRSGMKDLIARITPRNSCRSDSLIAVLTFPDVVRLKAVENDQMVGFVAGDPRPSQGFSWIATIGVLPEYRRRGIGRDLLHACEAQLKTPRLRLSVRASNQAAITLYEREGYRTTDLWKGYYDDGENAIVMEKPRQLDGL